MKQTKYFYLKLIAGLVLLPITLIIFFIDRAILMFLVWMPSEPIQKWFDNTQKMIQTMIRIGAVTFIYLIYKFFEWII
jgi:phosphotransferase system  glucose/maltose/N-acetylglucosamine-specific IIC component